MLSKLVASFLRRCHIEIKKISKESDLSLYTSLYGQEIVSQRPFYNIGAGSFHHPLWTNIDYYSDWYQKNNDNVHLHFDLMSLNQLPVEDNSARIVYSSHTIEHIHDKAAQNMFNESFRILRKGGYLRVTAPNVDLHYGAYTANDLHFYYMKEHYSKQKEMNRVALRKPMNEATIGELFLWYIATSVSPLHADGCKKRITDGELKKIFAEKTYRQALDYLVSRCSFEVQKKYPGNHINWWNPGKTIKMLNKAGFKTVYNSGYGQSLCPVLRDVHYFDNTHPKWSFYVEAVK